MIEKPLLHGLNIALLIRYFRPALRFYVYVGYLPNLAYPLRFSERMLWRKLFDHNPRFRVFCDKLATKQFIRERYPSLPTAEVLWVGQDPSKIPIDLWSPKVVLKTSHGWNQNLFGRDSATFTAENQDRVEQWLNMAHGAHLHEWAYQEIPRQIFLEACVTDSQGNAPIDLSIHAAGGRAILVEVIEGNKTAQQRKGYFHPDGTRWHEAERNGGRSSSSLPADYRMPQNAAAAMAATEVLGADIDYARFDFLDTKEALYGGEITVYPGSGIQPAKSFPTFNAHISAHWDLTRCWFLSEPQTGLRGMQARLLKRVLSAT